MSMIDQPPELRDEPEDSRKLPDLEKAAERVNLFLMTFGDGLVTSARDPYAPRSQAVPLYARDLQVLTNFVRDSA